MNKNQLHVKARGAHPQYPARFAVPDEFVLLEKNFPEYKPTDYTAQTVVDNDETKKKGGWADPMDVSLVKNMEGRTSYETGKLKIDPESQKPLNPRGRTGMVNRGLLGKYGPNFAADPVVTRINPKNKKIQMVAIKRKDNGEWAIPGGMVDAGEPVSVTLKREFKEEAANCPTDEEKVEMELLTEELFECGEEIYKGYVDDPRNTDNAWMETSVFHFHCNKKLAEKLNLHAGDDAAEVKWLDMDEENKDYKNLYASHKEFADKAKSRILEKLVI